MAATSAPWFPWAGQYLRSVLFLARVALGNSYRNTFLGLAWSMLNPIIQVIIYSVVFSYILRFPVRNYTLYLVSGILPWTLFTNTLLASADSLLARGYEIKHCLVSKSIFPISDALNLLYVFTISFAAMYGFLILVLGGLQWKIVLLPLALLPLLIVCFSASVAIAYLAPYARDIKHLLGVLFAALFWLTPIIYPVRGVPKALALIVRCNPLHYLLLPVKISVYGGPGGFVGAWLVALVLALLLALASYLLYKRLKERVIFYI